MDPVHVLIASAYAAFNARDIDGALTSMHSDVEWPNGMEGGYVHGHDGVRDYWTRQWRSLDPHVDPTRLERDEAGRVVVSVHQIVRDVEGKLLADRLVQHVYSLRDGLISRMDIREL